MTKMTEHTFLNLSLYECSRGAMITAIYKFVIKFIIVIHEAKPFGMSKSPRSMLVTLK